MPFLSVSGSYQAVDSEDFLYWFNTLIATPLFVSQVCWMVKAVSMAVGASLIALVPIITWFFRNDKAEFSPLTLGITCFMLGIISMKNHMVYGVLAAGSIFFNYFLGPQIAKHMGMCKDDFLINGLGVTAGFFMLTLFGY